MSVIHVLGESAVRSLALALSVAILLRRETTTPETADEPELRQLVSITE